MITVVRTRLTRLAILGAVALLAMAGTALATGVWSAPRPLDTAGARPATSYLVACPSASLCLGASGSTGFFGGPVAYHLSSAGTAQSALVAGLTIPFGSGDNDATFAALQCPTAALCVATADYSNDEEDDLDVVVSSTPAAGPSSWLPQDVQDPPVQLSCPSAAFCAGAGQDGAIVTSQDPSGGSAAWPATKLAAQILEVQCASATFCLAMDADGDVWTSTQPAGGASAWVRSGAPAPLKVPATIDAGGGGVGPTGAALAEDLSCASPNLCIASQASGSVLVSTDPAGPGAWTSVPVSRATISAVDCEAGTTLCLAGDSAGNIATSRDGAAADWASVATVAASSGIGDLSCAGPACVATSAAYSGSAPLRAAVPAGAGAWQWNPLTVTIHDSLSSVSCPSARQCIGADQARYYSSADPARGLRSWHARVVADVPGDQGINTLDTACYSATDCLAVTDDAANGLADVSGGSLYRFDPAGGAHDFHDTGVGGGNDILFVACAQGTCVAGFPGNWYQTAHPGLNRGWKRTAHPRFDVTCLQGDRSCVALADGPFPGVAGPDLLVAARRGGPWRSQTIDPGGQITGLACTSARACVVVDAAGRMLVSSAPGSGPGAWRVSVRDPRGFNGVACENARTCVAVDGNGGVVVGRP